MDVALRGARAQDAAFLQQVYASTRAAELAVLPWSDEQKQAFVAHQFQAQSAHYAEHYPTLDRYVIVIDGSDAGRLLVDRWPREIRIVDIAVLPAFRGRGAGTRLLGELIAEAESSGRVLSIHVEKNNPARSLYDRLGFRPAEDVGVYLRMERPVAQAKIA